MRLRSRSAAIAALAELLDRIGRSDEILSPQSAAVAERVRSSTKVVTADLDAALVLGWFHWLRYQALPEGPDEVELVAARRCLWPVYRVRPDAVPDVLCLDFDRVEAARGDARPASDRALGLMAVYQASGAVELVERSVELFRAAAADAPAGHPDRAGHLSNLANTVQMLFRETREQRLLEEAIEIGRAALAAAPAGYVHRATILSSLSNALRERFELTGSRADLEEAVQLGRAAAAVVPKGHRDPAALLCPLGNALVELYEQTMDEEALREGVSVLRTVLAAAPDGGPDRARYLNNLSSALLKLFERTGQPTVLDEAVEAGRAARAALPDDNREAPMILHTLANALIAVFKQTGRTDALDEAVAFERLALDTLPENQRQRAEMESNLALAMMMLGSSTGRSDLVEEAVWCARQAVTHAPETHHARPALLSNLGLTLQARFGRTGEQRVLAEAVRVGRAAVAAAPEEYVGRAMILGNLSQALGMLFERSGRLEELDDAVRYGREAVAAAPGERGGRVHALSVLGIVLELWYHRTGELDALEEAVEAGREALAAGPEDHVDRVNILNNLVMMLRLRFDRTGQPGALQDAVRLAREAVAATPERHGERASRLNNLGAVLLERWALTEDPSDLAAALQVARAAVEAVPGDHPGRPAALGNLGLALYAQFRSAGEADALDEAIEAERAAVALMPLDHPERGLRLKNLGLSLEDRFGRTGDQAVLDEARRAYREAASSTEAAPLARIIAYRQLASTAGPGSEQDALQCVEDAIDLVDALAPGSLARADREHLLGHTADLAGEAAAAALGAGRPERAVELLERARGILAADALGMGGEDQIRLREHVPELADRLEQLRSRLDVLGRARKSASGIGALISGPDTRNGDERREAYAEWLELLDEIREVSGFADFFRAPRVADLARHTANGPVVYVTAGPKHGSALILTAAADPVQVVELPGLTWHTAADRVDQLLAARRAAHDPATDRGTRLAAQREFLEILSWIWDTVTAPVLARLGHTAAPVPPEPLPRVWWCPVGVLAFLPLHAAGRYDPGGDPSADPSAAPTAALDLVVSSYTPTVRALARARSPRPPGAAAPAMLIVPVPQVPGAQLPGAAAECELISTLIADAYTLHRPTRAAVLDALPGCGLAHFACHGHVDWDEPARSRLILTDHEAAPFTVADLTSLSLDADLAFLSACSTSVTAPRLVDEALHITGAFHLAGFRHVVGTLWPVSDQVAARIAADFYDHLTAGGTAAPDPGRSGEALHHATVRQRAQYPAMPTLWAAHTHTGG